MAAVTSVWQKLLDSATRNSEMRNSTLLVVGNRSSGKSKLLDSFHSKFSNRQDATYSSSPSEHDAPDASGSPLRYSFLPAIHPNDDDADIDTAATCDVWCLSNPKHGRFLDVALRKDALDRGLAVVVVLDFQRPATIVSSLEEWLATIVAEMKSRLEQHPDRSDLLQRNEDFVRLYRVNNVNNSAAKDSSSSAASVIGSDDASQANSLATAAIDLAEGVLTTNCGVPIIVVCNKTDVIGDGDVTMAAADHVQRKIREVCLAHGAALVFASSKHKTQTDLLHRYVLHRLYPAHFPFDDAAEVVDGKNIFIPSGWDSLALVEDLEIDKSIDLSKCGKPPVGESARSDLTARKDTTMEVTAYTEQAFLERLMKKQETEEKLRVGSDASKLRSAVTNIGGGSEKIKKSDRRSSSQKSEAGEGGGEGGGGGGAGGGGGSVSQRSTAKDGASSSSRTSKTRTSSGGKSKSSLAAEAVGSAKDNPKLIKNFFQSLLNPKDKKNDKKSSSSSSTSKRRSTKSSSEKPKE